jgi:hypothetical protein
VSRPHPEPLVDLTARLRRVDLLLLRAVVRQRARPAVHAKGQYWGQFVTDDEVDALLRAQGEIDVPVGADLAGVDDALERSVAWRDADVPGSRIAGLRAAFDLDGDDLDLLLLAVAPEISAGYGKILAYLHDDVHRDHLSVDLASRVLRTGRSERLALQNRLLPGAPLVEQRLVLLSPEEGRGPQAARRVSLPPRLLHWLLRDGPVPLDAGCTRVDVDGEPFVPASCAERVAVFARSVPPTGPHPVTVAIVGGTPGLREGVAVAVARASGRGLVRVDVERCKAYLAEPRDLVRDLRLGGDVPYVVGVPDFAGDPEQRERMMHLGTALAALPYPLCVGGRDRRSLSTMLGPDRPRLELPVGRATVAERASAWRAALGARGWTTVDVDALAVRFSTVGGTTIPRVLERVAAELGDGVPDDALVQAACRELTRPEPSGLVQHVLPRHAWDDLVLPDCLLAQLRQLEDVIAEQETVLLGWGQQRLRPRGFGLKALFSGAPGTGKTMCAEVIAGSLGYDLFRVDLSSVVSKWVGETEKNLRQVFDAAEGGTSVLLFDEGDALFGSRGEQTSAQDRYANQEVAYLLQRLEAYEGCAIVTTNLQENVDEAFLRRFGAVVEFPFPGPEERKRLWERALPLDRSLVADDVDTALLGRRFHLAGGSIVNAALDACVAAARHRERLGLRHLVAAVARELTKLGRQINRVSFGDLLELVDARQR